MTELYLGDQDRPNTIKVAEAGIYLLNTAESTFGHLLPA